MQMTRRRMLTALAGAAATTALAACARSDDEWTSRDDNEDCDTGDLAENDPDCGYYDDGVWVYYPWVHPVSGGKPPAGQHPRPPKGVKGAPPRRDGGSGNSGTRTGGGSRTSGGGSRTSGGSGTRSGGGRR